MRVLLMLSMVMLFTTCSTLKDPKNLITEFNSYYDESGVKMTNLIDWVSKNIDTHESYVINYRLRAGEVFYYYLDSDLKSSGFFEPINKMPSSLLNVLNKSTVSNIIKLKNKNYFEVKLARFVESGYNVEILVSEKEADLHNIADDISTNFHDYPEKKWLYKRTTKFAFLVSSATK